MADLRFYAFSIIVFLVSFTYSEDCLDVNGVIVYTCAGNCCPQNRTSCCEPDGDYFVNNDSFVMIISIIVILLCVALSILFVICCFWSPCPLYPLCRMNYTYGDIVAYSKEEEALNLPPESLDKNNYYSPLQIKIKTVDEY